MILRMAARLAMLVLLSACDASPKETPAVSEPSDPTPKTPAIDPATPSKGTLLWNLDWYEAEKVLRPETVVVIPLGAASKEHGPHLHLNNDWLMAEYYKERVLQAADVVIAPTLGFHYYPAFVEYPGSTSLSKETSQAIVTEICRGLSVFGPHRFYILNTGVSTLGPLEASAKELAAEGIVMHYTNILTVAGPVEEEIREQPGGTHADEIETSMMLYIAPDTVDMSKAVKDWTPKTKPGFTRVPDGPKHYSKTGIWGDPTLATRAKGERVVEATVKGMLDDIETLRSTALPDPASP